MATKKRGKCSECGRMRPLAHQGMKLCGGCYSRHRRNMRADAETVEPQPSVPVAAPPDPVDVEAGPVDVEAGPDDDEVPIPAGCVSFHVSLAGDTYVSGVLPKALADRVMTVVFNPAAWVLR